LRTKKEEREVKVSESKPKEEEQSEVKYGDVATQLMRFLKNKKEGKIEVSYYNENLKAKSQIK
jgi:hypothetical protein